MWKLNEGKAAEYKDVHLSFQARTPKLHLALHLYPIANSYTAADIVIILIIHAMKLRVKG